MTAGVLARAARRQGQRGLLAWRAALGEVPASPQLQQGEQQGHPSMPWETAAGAAPGQPQRPCGTRFWHTAAAPRSGLLPAAGGVPPAVAAAGAVSAAAGDAPLWLRQQRRGMALNFARYQKRRQPQEERTLPEKNEEIKAKEVSWRFL